MGLDHYKMSERDMAAKLHAMINDGLWVLNIEDMDSCPLDSCAICQALEKHLIAYVNANA